jgi:hypothetical protein
MALQARSCSTIWQLKNCSGVADLPAGHASATSVAVCPLLRLLLTALEAFARESLGYARETEVEMSITVVNTALVAAAATFAEQSLLAVWLCNQAGGILFSMSCSAHIRHGSCMSDT